MVTFVVKLLQLQFAQQKCFYVYMYVRYVSADAFFFFLAHVTEIPVNK